MAEEKEKSDTKDRISKFFSKKWFIIILTSMVIGVSFSYYQNNFLVTTKIQVSSDSIPKGFDSFKIVHLSDLHSKWFGENQERLIDRVENEKPDIIVFTGDLIDGKNPKLDPAVNLMTQLEDLAPTYFVTGNHEWWSQELNSLEKKLKEIGISVLRNSSEVLTRGNDEITIIGIDDPANIEESYAENDVVRQSLKQTMENSTKTDFTILLSHRPEMFSLYQEFDVDLTFSGHAHGGQFRLPFIGGLIAPNQGLLPKYTAGKYTENGSTMIVSRGLGNSVIPQRIFNRPEVVSVTLER